MITCRKKPLDRICYYYKTWRLCNHFNCGHKRVYNPCNKYISCVAFTRVDNRRFSFSCLQKNSIKMSTRNAKDGRSRPIKHPTLTSHRRLQVTSTTLWILLAMPKRSDDWEPFINEWPPGQFVRPLPVCRIICLSVSLLFQLSNGQSKY